MAAVLRRYQTVQDYRNGTCVHDNLSAVYVLDVLLGRGGVRHSRDDKSGGEYGNDGSKIHKLIPVAERT